jgi:hypothetical protein
MTTIARSAATAAKKGHWACEYRKKQQDEAAKAAATPGTANLVQVEEDDEPGLMMACIIEVHAHTRTASGNGDTRADGHIFLNE